MIYETTEQRFLRIVREKISQRGDFDWVHTNVGWMEGCGKTDLGVQLCHAIDPDYGQENMVINPKDFIPAIKNPNNRVVHVIEGAEVFYSQDSSQNIQKKNMKFLFLCRIYHKFIDIDIPQFFYLNSKIRENRIRSVIRIRKRGRFWFYNKRRIMQIKKNKDSGEITWSNRPSFKDGWSKCTRDLRKLYRIAEQLKSEYAEAYEKEEMKEAEDLFHHKCKICGGEWSGKKPNPIQCGRCGTRKWNRDDVCVQVVSAAPRALDEKSENSGTKKSNKAVTFKM